MQVFDDATTALPSPISMPYEEEARSGEDEDAEIGNKEVSGC